MSIPPSTNTLTSGNALTDFFLQEVGITQYQFNVGQQLLSAGIVLLEIPSNIILYRVGPTLWLGGQILAWGLVATFQAFQKGLGPYLATRLLLGYGWTPLCLFEPRLSNALADSGDSLCESGFIPAGLYTITRWYKREETSRRFSLYFLGCYLAVGSSSLIAYGM